MLGIPMSWPGSLYRSRNWSLCRTQRQNIKVSSVSAWNVRGPRKRRYIDWKSIQNLICCKCKGIYTFTQFQKQIKYDMLKTLFLNQNAHSFVYNISFAPAPSIHVVLLGIHEPWSHTISPVQQKNIASQASFVWAMHQKSKKLTRNKSLGIADL